jgi:hypothetical protein
MENGGYDNFLEMCAAQLRQIEKARNRLSSSDEEN